MKKAELRQIIKEEVQKVLSEGKIKNQYVVKDEEESDEEFDFYTIDKKKALEYLKQFDKKGSVNARQFIKDDEGWGEFEQYLEDMEKMSDKQLEKAMREEMSYYFFSEPDEI
jgi:predicted N-acyltransferase